jgi:phage recombination protein Bet
MADQQAALGEDAQEEEKQPEAVAEEGAAEEEKPSREVLPDTRGAAITVPARLGFEQQQVVAIKNTVAADCNDAELVMFLEVAARYGLDPFAKQIYAAKMKGRVQIIVSRDGLLAHAHKQDTFVQMDGDIVHANDDFRVVFEKGERDIHHSYSTKVDPGKSGPEGEPLGDRGPIVGAWARVVRRGHGTTFFFAPMDEYKQDRDGPWQKTPSAMILKCAETYSLRKAFSISGVVGEDEVEKERKRLTEVEGEPVVAQLEEIDFGEEPRASYIRELARIANEIKPGAYRAAKLMGLSADPDGLVNELSAFITENGGEVPAEPVDGVAVEVEAEEEVDAAATPA